MMYIGLLDTTGQKHSDRQKTDRQTTQCAKGATDSTVGQN